MSSCLLHILLAFALVFGVQGDDKPRKIHGNDNLSPFVKSQQLAKQFQANLSFTGVWKVLKNGQDVFNAPLGYANEDNQVPMKMDKVFPIGSNTKLFTAVALYQLQEQGKVDLSRPVNSDLTQQDFANFGLPNQSTWCPKLPGSDECQQITYQHLLSMSSGIGDSFNCDNVQGQYCHGQEYFGVYKGSVGAYIGLFINDPLVFKPGTNYSYSNPNFQLATYMIEKFSGMKYGEYLQENIFKPLRLENTYYDAYDGEFGIIKNYANQYYRFWDADTNKPFGIGSCGPFLPSGAPNGAGGMVATVGDVAKWYLDLFSNQGKTSKLLTQKSILQIVKPWNFVRQDKAYFGQGILVTYDQFTSNGTIIPVDDPSQFGLFPTLLSYCGGTICANTCIEMLLPSKATKNKSIIAAAFSNYEFVYFDNKTVYNQVKNTQQIPELVNTNPSVESTDGNAGHLRSTLLKLWAFNQ